MDGRINFDEILKNIQKEIQQKASKATKQLLTDIQKETLTAREVKLIKQFKKAISTCQYGDAKYVMRDLHDVMNRLNKKTKLIEHKNKLYELAIQEQDYEVAIDGLNSNRLVVGTRTRTHLEATALLAIAHLRKGEIESAKPFIKDVLQNTHVIKSPGTRARFNKEIIKRFDEEITLFALKQESKTEINQDALTEKVQKLLKTHTNQQLYKLIGQETSTNLKVLLIEVDRYSKNQLPPHEQMLLPSSDIFIEDEPSGITIFESTKRVIYKSLCDQNSEVYKMWFTNGISNLASKKFIIGAVSAAFLGFGIGTMALIAYAATLVIRFGLDIYCEKYNPASLMENRGRS